MAITLPEQLQKEVEALAQQEGITPDALVVQAVERFLRKQQYPISRARQLSEHEYKKPTDELTGNKKLTPRQRLRELSRRKLSDGGDFITEIRLAKARAYQLYLDNEEWFDLSARRIAESRQTYLDEQSPEG